MAQNGFKNLLWFMGVVEDRYDPRKLGRVRVRCFDIHPDSKEDVPTETLPWAIPVLGTYNIDYKPPIEGSWVFGFFLDGEDAQHPMILGVMPGMPTTPVDKTKGFNAQHDNYPAAEDIYQPDIPRTARAESVEDTHVAERLTTRETYSRVDDNGEPFTLWQESITSYNTQYPYNKVYSTEGGHSIEMDDTPGSERVLVHHKSGSFIEIKPNGEIQMRSQGDTETVVLKNNTLFIRGNNSVFIEGSNDVYVDGHSKITVDGDLQTEVHGDYRLNVAGGIYLNSGDIFSQKSSSIRQEAALESINLYGNKNIQLQTNEGNMFLNSGNNMFSYASNNYTLEIGANTYIHSNGQYNVFSNNDIAMEGTRIDLNTEGAVELDPGYSAYFAGELTPYAKPSGKKAVLRPQMADPPDRMLVTPVSFTDSGYPTFLDTSEVSGEDVQ